MSDADDLNAIKRLAAFSEDGDAKITTIGKLLRISEADRVSDLNPGGFGESDLQKALRIQDWHAAFVGANGRAPHWLNEFKNKHWKNLRDGYIEHIREIVSFSTPAARAVPTIYTFLAVDDSVGQRAKYGVDIDKILMLQDWCNSFKKANNRDPDWKNDFSMGDWLTLDAADASFPEMMMKCLQYSFRFQNAKLFPIYNHQKYKIFDEDRIMTYAKANIIDVSTVTTDVISGSNQEEFSREFGKSLGIEASAVAPIAAAEIKSSKSTSGSKSGGKSSKYSQSRLQVTKKFLRLQSAFISISELEYYLDEAVCKEMKAINTPDKATKFLKKYGRFYLTQVHVGGLRTYATEDEDKFSSAESKTSMEGSVGGAAPVASGITAKTKLSFSNFSNSSKKSGSKNSSVKGTTLGGTPAYFQADKESWIGSIAELNYEISQCKFKPLFFLIPHQELAEGEQNEWSIVRDLLKEAHLLTVQPKNEDDEDDQICDKKKFFVINQAYDNIYLNEGDPTTDIKVELTILENFTEPRMGELELEGDSIKGQHVALQTSEGALLSGVKKLFSEKGKLYFNFDKDRTDDCNQWFLDPVRGRTGCFYIVSDEKYMLGVKKVGTNKYSYVMRNMTKDENKKTMNFMWHFDAVGSEGDIPVKRGAKSNTSRSFASEY